MKKKEEEKKGFWSSLFASKQCDCCCGTIIEEVDIKPQIEESGKDKTENRPKTDSNNNEPKCSCGGNC